MKRRPRGTGSIYETGDKRKEFKYRGELIIGTKANGEKIRKTFRGATQAEVDAQMRKFKKAGNEKVILFSEALDNMFEYKVKEKHIKEKTKTLIEGLINNHLNPAFGGFTLEKLNNEFVKNQFKKWEDKYSYSLRKKLLQNASLSFKLACENYKINLENPFKGITIHNEKRNKPNAVNYFTDEQLTSIIAEMRENRYPMIVSCLWNSGLRINELLALTVDDLDFENDAINIDKTLIETPDKDGKWRIKCQNSPKSKLSFRIVPMLGTMRQDLLKALEISKPYSDKLVFCTQSGGYVSSRNVTRAFESAKRRVGIKGKNLGLHAIRHSTVIMLIENSALLKDKADTSSIDISKIMGHEIDIMAYTYDNEQLERSKRMKKDYDAATVLKALMAEKEKSQELDENCYLHEAIDNVHALCDSGEIDFKYKADAISYMMTKIRERIEYINVGIKEELRGELMEYDREDDTSHVFEKYKFLKEKLISKIGDFDKDDFEQYMILRKF